VPAKNIEDINEGQEGGRRSRARELIRHLFALLIRQRDCVAWLGRSGGAG
jgi:hypothetical protein